MARPHVNVPLIVAGRRVIPDFRWPELQLIVEADGAAWHDDKLAREDDAERQALLEANGERVLRVTWAEASPTAPRPSLACAPLECRRLQWRLARPRDRPVAARRSLHACSARQRCRRGSTPRRGVAFLRLRGDRRALQRRSGLLVPPLRQGAAAGSRSDRRRLARVSPTRRAAGRRATGRC